ncbi:alpha/beta fold hydrolase [Hyphomicrobium sp. 99]|uniref:alpha/beta fold hydrolase n=1 Tax=Hyphomicrobium sp. 99 TaxID=1163419 RepID=UPI0006962E89|nr:alpha/beta fold hydrolase [Hyphomicrobium sp. 99]
MSIRISGRTSHVAANGLKHHLLTYAGGNAGDVLILPGITSPAPTADFIAAPLAARGFNVVVPDLRGRGMTDAPLSGRYRLIDYAADVAGLILELGLSRPHIIGHSLGARIAAAYAAEFCSDDHGMLVLVDPPTSGPGRGTYPTSRAAFLEQLHAAKRGTTAEEVRVFYPKWPTRELQLRAEVLASCDETAVVETHAGFNNEDFFALWSVLKRPATLVRGEISPVVPPSAAAELAVANPHIPIVSVPNAGHMVPWDNFNDFFKILVRLIPRAQKAA